jgi:hypothetical protein
MRDDDENLKEANDSSEPPGLFRRDFLRLSGISLR